MGAKWQFVASNPNGADAETKRTVRKAAMRAFRRSQREERTQKFQKREPGSSPESDGSVHRSTVEIKQEQLSEVEHSQTPRHLVLTPPQPFNGSPGTTLVYPSLSDTIDSGELSENHPEPTLSKPLSHGLQSAVGFSSPTDLGTPQNYYLFTHCKC